MVSAYIFLLNLNCHRVLAKCEHQKENFSKEDFLLGYHQGTDQSPKSSNWLERSHLAFFFPSGHCPRVSGVPHPVIPGPCSLPAQDHPQGNVWALGCFGDGLVCCQIVLAASEGHFSCLQVWMLRGEHSNRAFSTCSQALWVSVSASESSR